MTRPINSNVIIKEAIPAKSPNNFPPCARIVRKEESTSCSVLTADRLLQWLNKCRLPDTVVQFGQVLV